MKNQRFIGTIVLVVCTFTLTLFPALTAHAVDSSWTNTAGGNWSDPSNWRTNVPGPTTNAFITNSLPAASSFTVTNDVVDNTFANLTMWNMGLGTNTLLINATGLNLTGSAILGQRAIFDLNGFSAAIGGSLTISNLASVIVRGATLTNNGNASLVGGGLVVITNNGTWMVGNTGQGSLSNSSGTIRIGSGGTLAVGVITNRGIITTQFGGAGNGIMTGSIFNVNVTTTYGSAGLNVAGGANDSSLSLLGLHPFLNDVNNGTITIASNGTLNVGGVDAASSTATFTNRSTITIIGGAQVDSRITTLNAGVLVNDTNGVISMFNSATLAGVTNFINADVVNKGSFTINSAGPLIRLIRSVYNSGAMDLGGLSGGVTIIQEGSFTNDGRLATGTSAGQTLIITNGGLLNSSTGIINFNRTIVRGLYFVQDGALNVTNTGQVAQLLSTDGSRLNFTNNGTILCYSSAGQNDNAMLMFGAMDNASVITLIGRTNVAANGIPTTQITSMDGFVSNRVSGVIDATSSALASFDKGLRNLGTINIESNSVLSINHSGAGANLSATSFRFLGGTGAWTNEGTINMPDGAFLAVSSLTNAPGGLISGRGQFGTVLFQTITNVPGGTVTQYVQNVTVGNVLNAGTIAPNGSLNVGAITNLSGGSIIGSGVIQSISTSNFYSGLTFVSSNIYTGARILNNAGATILANGGTLVLSNGLVANSNSGTLGATNGILQLGDGTLALTNNVTGTIFAYNGDLHLGPLRNNGTIQIINSSVTFSNLLVNAGRYISDPSINTFFDDVTILPAGTLEGGTGDVFDFKSDLIINSTNTSLFDLASSEVSFSGGGDHTNAVTGLDFGPLLIGLASSNFAYGTLTLGPSDDVYFIDGDGIGGNTNALYVRLVDLGGDTNNVALLHNAFPGSFNIYYDGDNPFNGYLGGQTYGFSGGGMLIPLIPEPTTATLLLLAVAGFLRRRVQRS